MSWGLYKHGIYTFGGATGDSALAITNSHQAIGDYLDGVALAAAGAVAGHLCSLTGAGQPADSGIAATAVSGHLASTSNPHNVSKAQVGLGNVGNSLQLVAANNLSDLPSASAARTALQLGTAALSNATAFDAAGAAAAVNTTLGTHTSNHSNPHVVTAAQIGLGSVTNALQLVAANNLSDLSDAAAARTNLQLGSAAQNNTGDFVSATSPTFSTDVDFGGHNATNVTAITGPTGGGTLTVTANAGINLSSVVNGPGNLWNLDDEGHITAVSLSCARVTSGVVEAGSQAGTYTTDATVNEVRITLTDSLTLATPTGAADGQGIAFWLTQDGTGNRTLTLSADFIVPSSIGSITLSTAAGTTDLLTVVYIASVSKFRVTGFLTGYAS